MEDISQLQASGKVYEDDNNKVGEKDNKQSHQNVMVLSDEEDNLQKQDSNWTNQTSRFCPTQLN